MRTYYDCVRAIDEHVKRPLARICSARALLVMDARSMTRIDAEGGKQDERII